MRTIRRLASAVAIATLAWPAGADEVEAALETALDAYRAGDLGLAQEEAAFATDLLRQQAAQSLARFLPAPLSGWTATAVDANGAGGLAAMFGGGLAANRTYTKGGESVDVMLMADNPMVAQLATMLSSPVMLGEGGTLKRLGGQRAAITGDGEIMALVANRVLIQIGGSAPVEAKEAYFTAIDLDALGAF